MLSRTFDIATLPVPVLMVSAWIITIAIVSLLARSIIKTVINKADAQDLPRVLTALAPILRGVTNSLAQSPNGVLGTGPSGTPSASTSQNGEPGAGEMGAGK
ncbi:hypothetical protein [Nonomuraea sp. NPDC005650]|uniref:hypothetical protein n=1 Tax=Nonomuraea sp. NPDC005650 TaxID=3157045 RepID=UPI0033A88057